MSMTDSVSAALSADTTADTDQAIASLALAYAGAIDDDPALLKDLGPKLLSALESLQLSPRARALARVHSLSKAAPDAERSGDRDDLATLRARRRRKSYPSALDTPAP